MTSTFVGFPDRGPPCVFTSIRASLTQSNELRATTFPVHPHRLINLGGQIRFASSISLPNGLFQLLVYLSPKNNIALQRTTFVMLRQIARPLARQNISALNLARSISTSKALPVRPQSQSLLTTQRVPQVTTLTAQASLLRRQFVTSESRKDVKEKAIEQQSNVDFQHTTTGAKEEVRWKVSTMLSWFATKSQFIGQSCRQGFRRDDRWTVPSSRCRWSSRIASRP